MDNKEVVHEDLNSILHNMRKNRHHAMFKSYGIITKAKRHPLKCKYNIKTSETGLLLVHRSNLNLCILQITTKENNVMLYLQDNLTSGP